MNKFFILIASVLIAFCPAQTNRFIYELDYRKDSTENYRKNLMVLDINPTQTKFYDYDFLQYDSINKNSKETVSKYSTKTDQIVVREKNSTKNQWYRDFFDYFTIQTNDVQKWELFPVTQNYNGYTLQKANTDFGGRKWTAWFSNEVNIQEGPYKFRGLPGLIFLLEDAENNFKYKMVKNQKFANTFDTTAFLETNYGKKALPIKSVESFNQYIEDIYINPTRMFADRIKKGEKANFKNETIENIEELNQKKVMLQNGIKNRYIYLEKDLQPHFSRK